MSFYSFIFSNKRSTRLLRHLVFWSLWIFVHSLNQMLRRIEFLEFSPAKAAWYSLLEVLLQLPLDMLCVYSVIYLLIPRFLSHNKIFEFFLLWLGLDILIAVLNYAYIHGVVFPVRRMLAIGIPQQPGFVLYILSASSNFNLEAGFATSIRLLKQKIYQQGELRLFQNNLQKKNREIEAEHHKSLGFMQNLVQDLYEHTERHSPALTPFMYQFKELSHFVNVEARQQLVSVEQEWQSVVNYLKLLELSQSIEFTHCFQNTEGVRARVSPMVLIPLLEPYFARRNNHKATIDLKAALQKEWLHVQVSLWMMETTIADIANASHQPLTKKLKLKFPDGFRFSKIVENGSVLLKLDLDLQKII